MAMVEADLSQTYASIWEKVASVTGTMIIVQTIISITVASSLQLVRPGLILSAM